MFAISPLLLGLVIGTGEKDLTVTPRPDLAHLQEMLHDRQHPHGQSQAALLLVQSKAEGADALVRQGLRQTEDPELFLALAAAVRLNGDLRFTDELFTALADSRPHIRQAAAETLAVLPDGRLVARLQRLVEEEKTTLPTRQAALWAMGRCGRKEAVTALLAHLKADDEAVRRAAATALADLSGQDYGLDVVRWTTWWERHKDLSREHWLQTRLAYQSSRAYRLEADLVRVRGQMLRLQQQLYSRLSGGERVSHLLTLLDQDDPAVRTLAVTWSVELLPGAEAEHRPVLTEILLRLSNDSAIEVQRTAILALGRVNEPAAFERLLHLAKADLPGVRTATLHALTLRALGRGGDAQDRQQQIIPLLQKALDDPALDVVVEAAEDLGMLGALEAGPVLTGLLHHVSEPVRQAAAQALERTAETAVLDALLDGLTDDCAAVRFSLVGAVGHAAAEKSGLREDQQKRLLARLEALLLHDSDPGVRSRAASVLGDCGPSSLLPTLWRCVQANEDGRVQEKAWAAFLDILARTGSLAVLLEWDRTLTAARQGPRRLQVLNEMVLRWQKQPERKELIVPTQEALVQAQLELGKWPAAAPVLRELLARPANDTELNRRLGWLRTAAEQALNEGKRVEAQQAVEIAQPFLPPSGQLKEAFTKLEQQLAPKE
jgi:HEAT repeat protein